MFYINLGSIRVNGRRLCINGSYPPRRRHTHGSLPAAMSYSFEYDVPMSHFRRPPPWPGHCLRISNRCQAGYIMASGRTRKIGPNLIPKRHAMCLKYMDEHLELTKMVFGENDPKKLEILRRRRDTIASCVRHYRKEVRDLLDNDEVPENYKVMAQFIVDIKLGVGAPRRPSHPVPVTLRLQPQAPVLDCSALETSDEDKPQSMEVDLFPEIKDVPSKSNKFSIPKFDFVDLPLPSVSQYRPIISNPTALLNPPDLVFRVFEIPRFFGPVIGSPLLGHYQNIDPLLHYLVPVNNGFSLDISRPPILVPVRDYGVGGNVIYSGSQGFCVVTPGYYVVVAKVTGVLAFVLCRIPTCV